LANHPTWVTTLLPSWNFGNGIRNTFPTTIAIDSGIGIIDVVNWGNKLVCCTTNGGLANRQTHP